jgi:2-methylisocitrate lyase-like PEP mutase family enzyme
MDHAPMENAAARLSAALAREAPLLCPGVFDALTAMLAERAGFSALYLSGASIAYTALGRPDIGLVSHTEVADVLARITERVETPVIVDGDAGFGNALNTQRVVRLFERAGAAMIQLEDQTFPKRCGHLAGKTLVPVAEMAGKLRAAADARRAGMLILARTDAIAVEGFSAALDRAEAYLEAGADALFVEAPENTAQMRAICDRFAHRAPLLANMVEGGRTPLAALAELGALGYRIVIYPGGTVRVLARTLEGYFASLRQTGSTEQHRDRMHDFSELQTLLGTEEMLRRGQDYG